MGFVVEVETEAEGDATVGPFSTYEGAVRFSDWCEANNVPSNVEPLSPVREYRAWLHNILKETP